MTDEDKLNALELLGENEYLHKEIERLNNIIKKAIVYVLGNDLDNFNNINNLLNILKGSDKE